MIGPRWLRLLYVRARLAVGLGYNPWTPRRIRKLTRLVDQLNAVGTLDGGGLADLEEACALARDQQSR